MPAHSLSERTRGFLIPIGGAEDKVGDTKILKRFVRLCGRKPSIAIIPTASRRDDAGRVYQDLFSGFEASATRVLQFSRREDCEDESALSVLSQCDGVFITGGNQLRLSTLIGGTPVAKLLRRRNADGMPIAGTSAGAAIMPAHMIAGGEEGATPRAGMVSLAPGLGLSNKIMIDQHFRQRDRIGRLLTALALNPFALALGIDEDTAAFIGPDNVLEVVGSSTVLVLDPSEVRHSTMAEAEHGEAVSITNVRLHILIPGMRYDIDARKVLDP
ncbi:MAG: cyanophycinase [Xanthomonadales bacterium]|nr:Cyanophycinase [Xanthomonadales bacterium]MCC6592429.1 cyanophycinase [Xanthomonadales bacterium]MCE7931210.1 cyanophycinase [Xanthomonadales bacterium PRO6]